MQSEEEAYPWSTGYDDGSTGVEIEDVNTGVSITEPFDPTLIRVTPKQMNVDLLLKRIAQDALDLSPGFQRKGGIWTNGAQSRLIESLLIRIPIPAIYVDATDDDRWLIVDGLQRLTALRRFVIAGELKLSGLEFLATELEGATFADLPLRFRRRILETQIFVYAIEEGTPPNVKFNIFKRINTGGLPLSPQEIRHALYYGKATAFLGELAQTPQFLKATDRGISDRRMADQECVLRFLAFTLTPYTTYKAGDFDGFLNQAMGTMSSMPDQELEILRGQFLQAMVTAVEIFERDSFRKRYSLSHGRYPINKALFEAWSVYLGKLEQAQRQILVLKRDELRVRFMELMNTREFDDAISLGTGDIRKVNRRFGEIERIIQEVLA